MTTSDDQPVIPFFRPAIGDEEINEVVDSLRSGWLTTGPKVARLEEDFRSYVGSRHAIAVNSGTAAMHLALAAAGIGEGDEVITTPLTFASTVMVIHHQGATPVLADVSIDDYNIDPAAIERCVTPRTRAIMPVHYAGQPCRMDEILSIASRHNLLVIEDAAHAIGASYRGRPVGSLGDATAFSFYATKNMTTGEGGMVTTDNDELAEKVRLLTLHGMSRDAWRRYEARGSWYYEIVLPGFKYNMTDLQAAIGIHQLAKIERLTEARRRVAELYTSLLGHLEELRLPATRPDVVHAWHLYPIWLDTSQLTLDRAGFIEQLRQRGILPSVHFIPIHHHPWFQQEYGWRPGDFPVTDRIYEGLVSLPLYPQMTENEAWRVAQAVIDIIAANRR